jgi:hypothetical protein
MMRYWISCLLLVGCWNPTAAQNLVPNPSLEDTTGCPDGPDQLYKTRFWSWACYGSVDYYHACGSNGYSVPVNVGGGSPKAAWRMQGL